MEINELKAQVEMMRNDALRMSVEHKDKWLNTFHAGRENALDQILKIIEERAD
ncbi:hypothetical protein [Enterococcus mundtii]